MKKTGRAPDGADHRVYLLDGAWRRLAHDIGSPELQERLREHLANRLSCDITRVQTHDTGDTFRIDLVATTSSACTLRDVPGVQPVRDAYEREIENHPGWVSPLHTDWRLDPRCEDGVRMPHLTTVGRDASTS